MVDFKVYLHARSNIVLELPLMVDPLVTYRPCVSMSILKVDELPATFVSRPNPRARERGGASNVRIGPRSGLCISSRTTVGGCRACISTFG